MEISLRVLYAACVILLCHASTVFSAEQEDVGYHFRECRLGWKFLRDQESVETGSNFQQKTSSGQSNEPLVRNLTVFVNSGNQSLQSTQSIYCKNEFYSFEIVRSSPQSEWVIERAGLDSADAPIDRQILMPNQDSGPSFMPLTYAPLNIILMMENNFLKFDNCKLLPNGNLSVVASALIPLPKPPQEILNKATVMLKKTKGKISDSDYSAMEKRMLGQINVSNVSIEMELDLNRNYLLLNGTFKCSSLPSRTYRIERTVKGISTLKNFDTLKVSTSSDGDIRNEKLFSNEFVRLGDATGLRGYFLSDYGFPEPQGIILPARTGYMRYLYIAIPVLAALGLLAAYMRRRSSRAAALPPAGTAGS